jgi:hypothetical protein
MKIRDEAWKGVHWFIASPYSARWRLRDSRSLCAPAPSWSTAMPRFQICPFDRSISASEIVATDAGGILNKIHRLECKEADVMCDGLYSFSARLEGNGLWCIFQREQAELVQVIPPIS